MKTVDRILSASLELLNDQGVARVTTNAIADAADLSVGNLYYHFKNKDDILIALFKQFQTEIAPLLETDVVDCNLEDWAQWWHQWFACVERYIFLFHDLSYLLHSNEHIRFRHNQLVDRVEAIQTSMFKSFKTNNLLIATTGDIHRIALEVTFIAVFWQDFFDQRLRSRHDNQSSANSALSQTLGLLLPYLKAPDQIQVEQLMKTDKSTAA